MRHVQALLLGPGVQHLLAEDIGRHTAAVEHIHLDLAGLVAENGMESLDHGSNAGSADQHGNLLPLEGSLCLDVELNVLEVDAVTNVEVLAEEPRHGTVLLVVLDEHIEGPDLGIRRDGRVGTDHGLHLAVGIRNVGLGQDTGAGAEVERLGLVGASEPEDARRLGDDKLFKESDRIPLCRELALAGRDQRQGRLGRESVGDTSTVGRAAEHDGGGGLVGLVVFLDLFLDLFLFVCECQ